MLAGRVAGLQLGRAHAAAAARWPPDCHSELERWGSGAAFPMGLRQQQAHAKARPPRQPTRPLRGKLRQNSQGSEEAGRGAVPSRAKVRKSFRWRAGSGPAVPAFCTGAPEGGWFPNSSRPRSAPAGSELQPRGQELHKWPRRPRSGRAARGQAGARAAGGPGLQAPRPLRQGMRSPRAAPPARPDGERGGGQND